MTAKDLVYTTLGLVVGVIAGILIISLTGSSSLNEETVRNIVAEEITASEARLTAALASGNVERTFGTRDADLSDLDFFLVDYNQAMPWLESITELDEEFVLDESIEEQFGAVATIDNSNDLIVYMTEQVSSADGVLATVYDALLIDLGDPNAEVIVCLGIDNDPYSLTGPKLYLYLQVPQELSEELDDKQEGWERLAAPKEESPLWSAECYDPEATTDEDVSS
ncbi:MAG: hypothetical protein D6711_08590 [Chloroflexi bacterium]|nr:MAG: hypothetical protein D6711_08590 [Chloroflexota bacterium]